MALPSHILVHVATPVTFVESAGSPATWLEGEPGGASSLAPVVGTPFACVLFLPSPGGSQDTPYRPRVIREPTLLYNPTRSVALAPLGAPHIAPSDQTDIVVPAEAELLVYAPELVSWTGAAEARWLAAGDAQPLGPPGRVIAIQQTLRMVQD